MKNDKSDLKEAKLFLEDIIKYSNDEADIKKAKEILKLKSDELILASVVDFFDEIFQAKKESYMRSIRTVLLKSGGAVDEKVLEACTEAALRMAINKVTNFVRKNDFDNTLVAIEQSFVDGFFSGFLAYESGHIGHKIEEGDNDDEVGIDDILPKTGKPSKTYH